jgi:hypothetical protein
MAFSYTKAITAESGVETVGSSTNCVFRTQLTATIIIITTTIIIIVFPELTHIC